MYSVRNLSYSLYFYLVPLVSLYFVWPVIPQYSTLFALIVAAIVIGLSASLRQMSYPTVGTPFFILLLANYWLVSLEYNDPLVIVITIFVLLMIPLTGLWARKINRLPVDRGIVTYWLVLGFMTAQVNSLLIFWPFSFFENTLISFIIYYTFWQLIQLYDSASRKSLIAHFVFTLLAAIVVIGAVIWVNYPQLRTF